jgi:LysM repeat protein
MIMMRSCKFLLLFLFSVLLILLSTQVGSAQQSQTSHTVQQGETLFSISQQYGITIDELREWNNLESNNLQPGQTLLIQKPGVEERIVHEVQPGESLFGISQQYGVTVAEIQEWNRMEGTTLEAGTDLIIYKKSQTGASAEADAETTPGIDELEEMDQDERSSVVRRFSETAQESESYTVKSGDTLYGIARKHEMSIQELRALNDLEGDMLRVGQRIIVKKVQKAPSIAEGSENSTPQGRFAIHTIESGETLQDILNRFKLSRSELQALNPDFSLNRVASGQELTVLLPPTRTFENPYKPDANMENLGTVPVTTYGTDEKTNVTTSGELYNPEMLTAAHSNMALGNIIFIENPESGTGVFVRVNDRHSGNGLKLSQKAYELLSFSSISQPLVTIYLEE